MADLARAEALVAAMERDAGFRAEVEAAPTVAAKRAALDARGFEDVGLEDMRAWVESKGGTLTVQPAGGRELSEQELAAVAGGVTNDEAAVAIIAVGSAIVVGTVAASAAV